MSRFVAGDTVVLNGHRVTVEEVHDDSLTVALVADEMLVGHFPQDWVPDPEPRTEPRWQPGDMVRDATGAVYQRSEDGPGWHRPADLLFYEDGDPERPLVRLVPEGSEREALTREIVEHAVEVAADPVPPVTYDDAEGDLDYRERHGPPLTPGTTVAHRDGRLGMYDSGACKAARWHPFGDPRPVFSDPADLRPVSLVEKPERKAFREIVRLAHTESDSVAALANRIYDTMFGPGEPS